MSALTLTKSQTPAAQVDNITEGVTALLARPYLQTAAAEWLTDCFPSYYGDENEFYRLTPYELAALVETHHSEGIAGFIRNAG